MEFRILGPLEIRRDGAEVPLPGRTLPRLLAVLLLEVGHVVPLSSLIDAVWEDNPPAAARRRIQNLVSELRTALTDRQVLETVGEGYRLRLTADQLDALAFERAVRQARRLADSGDPHQALPRLREALQWWRGPALAGLPGRLIEAGAQRWDEARLSAIEDRVELELAVGSGASVVGELRALLGRHPDRQRLVGLLMHALYQAGRETEALKTFHNMRTRLADEGIDPGQELIELHRAILRHDPALTPSPSDTNAGSGKGAALSPVAEAAPVPPSSAATPTTFPLPADTPRFTGRAEQLARLDEAAAAGPAPVVAALSGIGGSGKTALALRWAHQNADRFPDRKLYVNLRGSDHADPMPAHDALAWLLQALGVPARQVPADPAQASAVYRSLVDGRRVLVVLDNARDAAQVRPLLPNTQGSVTLVTSRRRLTGLSAREDAHLVTVDSLPPADSLRLLANMIGEERLAAEPAAGARLVELCAGLPLALRIVASDLLAQPGLRLGYVATALSGSDRIARLAVPGDDTAAVAAVFDLSYRTIDPVENQLYLRLAYLPHDDISRELAVALCDEPAPVADRALTGLETAHRIEQYRSGRYRFHDLVREYARNKALAVLDDAARQELRSRVIDFYTRRSDHLHADDYQNLAATCNAWADHPAAFRLREVTRKLASEVRNTADSTHSDQEAS